FFRLWPRKGIVQLNPEIPLTSRPKHYPKEPLLWTLFIGYEIPSINGIHRDRSRCSQKTNSEGGESFYKAGVTKNARLLTRLYVRVRKAVGANQMVNLIALQGLRTTVGHHVWGLVR